MNNLRVKSDMSPVYRRKQTGTLVPARVFTLLHEQQSNPSTPRDRYPKRSTSISFSLEQRYVTIVLHFDATNFPPPLTFIKNVRVIINRLNFPQIYLTLHPFELTITLFTKR